MSIATVSPLPALTLTVQSLVEPGNLAVTLEVAAGGAGLGREITHARIQKSGLALVGHFDGIAPGRVQILGETEMSFLDGMTWQQRQRSIEGFLDHGVSCVVVTSGMRIFDELLTAADERHCPVLRASERSAGTINALHAFLDERLAPRARIHGVFIDVFGVGILLLGRSGIGKSECALELVQRGHRLVADDVVDVTLRPPGYIYGSATELLKNHLEVRGLGVLDIKDLFGVAAVRDRKRVDLMVQLLATDDDTTWDRLGIDDEWHDVLSVRIPFRRVPVRPGKNTASTVEVAARNELLRQAGIHSARAFHSRLAQAFGVPDPAATQPPPSLASLGYGPDAVRKSPRPERGGET